MGILIFLDKCALHFSPISISKVKLYMKLPVFFFLISGKSCKQGGRIIENNTIARGKFTKMFN